MSEETCTDDETCSDLNEDEFDEFVDPNDEFQDDRAEDESGDPWGNMEEPEDSDETLLAEIQEEQRLADIAAAKAPPVQKPQLAVSEFQMQLITTGSGVGYALLVVLAFLFIVRCIEIVYKFFQRRRKLALVRKALDTTTQTSIENYTAGDPDRLSYVKYNSEFMVATEMDEKLRAGFRDRGVLTALLRDRALELIKRRVLLMQEEQSVHRGYQMDLIPMEVWNDFLAAKESLGQEFSKVRILCDKLQVPWEKLIQDAQDRYHNQRFKAGAPKRPSRAEQMRKMRLKSQKKLQKKEPPASADTAAPEEPTAKPTETVPNRSKVRRRRGRMKFGKKTFT